MSLGELRILANWHEDRAGLVKAKWRDARDAGLSPQEQRRLHEAHSFHDGAARGLKQLADAFATLSALSGQ